MIPTKADTVQRILLAFMLQRIGFDEREIPRPTPVGTIRIGDTEFVLEHDGAAVAVRGLRECEGCGALRISKQLGSLGAVAAFVAGGEGERHDCGT